VCNVTCWEIENISTGIRLINREHNFFGEGIFCIDIRIFQRENFDVSMTIVKTLCCVVLKLAMQCETTLFQTVFLYDCTGVIVNDNTTFIQF